MTCWVIIPAKAPPEAKGRLADVLDGAARAGLARAMLARAVEAVRGVENPGPRALNLQNLSPSPLGRGWGRGTTPAWNPHPQPLPGGEGGDSDLAHLALALVGTSRLGQSDGIELLPEPEGGLNAAVTSARNAVAARGATRIVTLAGDLPQVTADDVKALATLPSGVIGIAPDRHGTGTNALSLPLPEALGFTYSYGPGSCALHRAEAARLGLECREITTPGLARDIDEPADLADAQDLLAAQEG